VFANGGHLIDPYFIERIVDAENNVLFQAQPLRVCMDCRQSAETFALTESPAATPADAATKQAPAVLPPQNAWLITSMLQDVIRRGTGQRARELGREDLAGKTGTTNEQRDAWFCGYNRALVASAWIGFDEVAPLGDKETGGQAALPMWMRYMGKVLEGVPEQRMEQPPGLVTVRIDPQTGLLADSAQPDAIFETFREDQVPSSISLGGAVPGEPPGGGAGLPEQLF
jgi:penicillin-binding protein 1A